MDRIGMAKCQTGEALCDPLNGMECRICSIASGFSSPLGVPTKRCISLAPLTES